MDLMDVDYNIPLFIMWICVFTFILYRRHSTDTILVLFGCIITVLIYNTFNKIPANTIETDSHMIEWLDTLLTSKKNIDKHRYYHKIKNMLHSDTLSNNPKYNHTFVNQILEPFKPNVPVPSNIEDDTTYSVSVGFTRCE